MVNLLLEEVQYRIEENFYGTWKRHLDPTGSRFTEFRTHACFFGLPPLYFTFGVCPETGRQKVARGVIAIGRLAVGVLGFGQASLGVIALGQAGIGILALAQAGLGIFAIAQLAVALRFALGQLMSCPRNSLNKFSDLVLSPSLSSPPIKGGETYGIAINSLPIEWGRARASP